MSMGKGKKLLAYLLSALMVVMSVPVSTVEAAGQIPKPESAPQAETELQTESAPHAETEPQTESAPQAETGQQAESEPQAETESQTESEPQAETESQTESEPQAETESQTESEPQTESETQLETESEVPAETIENIPKEAIPEETYDTELDSESDDSPLPLISRDELEKLADEWAEEQGLKPEGYHDIGYVAERLEEPVAASDDSFYTATQAAPIPSSYSSKDAGRTSSVKNQGSWGTCWSFSAVSAAEIAYKSLNGTEADLSEIHLVNFFYNGNSGADLDGPDGGLSGDKTTAVGAVPVQRGGNSLFTTFAMAQWIGIANEATDASLVYPDADYTYENRYEELKIGSSYAYQDTVHLENAYWINLEDTGSVKEAVMEYGTVSVSYCDSPLYASDYKITSWDDGGNPTIYWDTDYQGPAVYYCDQRYATNHAVVIAGWDDNFDKEYFKNTCMNKYNAQAGGNVTLPQNNGAWLIKNSWGTDVSEEGYFWISYEDASLQGETAFAFDFNTADNYDHNYQYDGSNGTRTIYTGSDMTAGAVYTAGGDELVSAVGVGIASSSTDYEVRVYTNLTDENNPESGELQDTVTGKTSFEGFYTIELNDEIPVSAGENFGVVVTVSKDSSFPEFFIDCSYANGSWISFTASTENDRTFLKSGGSWVNPGKSENNPYTYRIKAYTIDAGNAENTFWVRFFDKDGKLLKKQRVKSGESAIAPEDPKVNGYSFTGWDKDYTCIIEDTDFRAQYEPICYPIYYYYDSVDTPIDPADNPNPKEYTIENTPIKLLPVSKKGYLFDYWIGIFDNGTDELYGDVIDTIPRGTYGDIYLFAFFEEDPASRARVRFLDYDGTVLKEEVILKGDFVIPPEDPERKGYLFTGWTGGEFSDIMEDTDFKAGYELEEYTITYYDDDGELITTEENPNPETYTVESETIILKPLERESCTFMGWLQKDGDSEHILTKIPKESTGDITLYAQWGYEGMELEVPQIYPISGIVEEGTEIAVIANPDAEIYYTLDGSAPSKNNGIKYSNPFELTDDKEETRLRAIAVRETETSGEASAVYQYKLIRLILEKVEKPVKAGSTYAIKVEQLPTGTSGTDISWTSSDETIADVSEKGVVTAHSPGTVRIKAQTQDYMNRTVEAICEITVGMPVYTVRFYDADNNLLSEQSVEKGKSAVPPKVPDRTGYLFTGWSGSYENINGNLDLKAEYKPAEYRITYELNGGSQTEGNPSVYTIETETILLKEPAKAKSFFRGWYRDSKFESGQVTEITKGSTGDITLYAKWFTPGGIWMEDIAPQVYTGSAVKPDGILVYDATVRLTEGVDYTVSYKNNVKAYTDGTGNAKNAPTITVKGKGNYSGTVTKTFEIMPFDIGDESVQADDIAAAYKSGTVKAPSPVVKWNGKKLAAKRDYTVEAASAYNEPGTYQIKIKGIGNFTGERTIDFTIASADQKPISAVKASKIPDQEYSGKAVVITDDMLKLKDGGYELKRGIDYTLDDTKYTDAGTYDIVVRGKGNYIGTRRISFKIKGTAVKAAKVDSWGKAEFVYSGMEQKPKPVLKIKDKILKENTDYVITGYADNVNAGTGKMTIKGKGAYSGTATLKFKIKPASADDRGLNVAFRNGSSRQPYEKGGTKPQIAVSFNGTVLVEGLDYKVSYKNNKAFPQKPGKEPAVVISGKRNFNGSRSIAFTITEKPLSDTGLIFAPDIMESKTAGKFYSTPQIYDTNGSRLAAGTDYERTMVYKSKTGKKLDKTDMPKAGSEIEIEITGKGAYTGTHKCTYRILPAKSNLAKAKVKVLKKYIYTGDEIILQTGDLEVKLDGEKLMMGTNYEITPYPGNPKKGKLKFLLTGKGKYGGSKTITVNVKPQGLKWWSKQ